jgi:hypothetical protein
MKLRRWLVILSLTSSVLAVVLAGAWWWITWPKRTAQEFAALVACQRIDDASRLMERRGDDNAMNGLRRSAVWLKDASVEAQSRTCLDIVQGTQTFYYGNMIFRVERGKVITLSSGLDLPYIPTR